MRACRSRKSGLSGPSCPKLRKRGSSLDDLPSARGGGAVAPERSVRASLGRRGRAGCQASAGSSASAASSSGESPESGKLIASERGHPHLVVAGARADPGRGAVAARGRSSGARPRGLASATWSTSTVWTSPPGTTRLACANDAGPVTPDGLGPPDRPRIRAATKCSAVRSGGRRRCAERHPRSPRLTHRRRPTVSGRRRKPSCCRWVGPLAVGDGGAQP